MLKKGLSKMNTAINNAAQEGNKYFLRNPKQVIITMIIIMVSSIVYLLFKNILSPTTHRDAIERIMKNIPSKDTLKMFASPIMEDFMKVRELEKELNNIMNKDSLNHDDSLFILNLNDQLNNMLDEKD